MNVHKNARLTPHGRERIVRQVEIGQTPKAVGEAAGVCPRTVRKWVSRYRSEGLAGLRDRSSRPHRLHRPTPQAVVTEVGRLRRQRYTGQQIAAELRISPATVSRILRRLGLNRLAALDPAEPERWQSRWSGYLIQQYWKIGYWRGMKTGRPRGRPKGARNKRTVQREADMRRTSASIEKSVEGAFEGDALAYLISIYKDPTKPENLRMDAAKVAIRYERPALASVEQAPQRDFIPLAERLKFYASRDLADADAAKLIEGESEAVAGY